jgi:hypothetical protein
MDYKYSRHGLKGKERLLERILEVIPGLLSWSIIFGMTILSFLKPLLATALIIAFLLYWFLRMVYSNILLFIAYAKFKSENGVDWMNRIEAVDSLDSYYESLSGESFEGRWSERISRRAHIRQLKKLMDSGSKPPHSKDIWHVVIIPVIKESREVVEPGIVAIEKGSYPSKRILLIIALEERASETISRQIHQLRGRHKEHFWDFLVVVHPADVPGEARVKGANTTYAARKAADYLREKAVPFENVIISCFDADTVASADYFSCLSYYFMITPERLKASFQPIPLYFNNIWDVPAFARIIDVGISFAQFVEVTDVRKLVTFSSHSMSFKALSDIGYWPVDIISDDSAVFWKALVHYGADYRVIPIPVAVSMDVVTGRTVTETFSSIYKQKRRWAWGAENFPLLVRGFLHSTTIPFYKKIDYTLRLLDKSTSWATYSFLLAVISWLPLVFASRQFSTTTVYYIAPRIRSTVFLLAFSGIAACMLMSFMMLPPEKTRYPLFRRILRTGEWLFIPFVILILSSLPALDAQTRLIFGRYMEFWVTDKYRSKKSPQGG